MKKNFLFLMCLTLMLITFWDIAPSVHAESGYGMGERVVSETTEYFDNGNYMTIVVAEEPQMMRGTVKETTGLKSVVLHDKSGNELWRFTVHGTFTVNSGVSAICTAASYSISITESAWQNESASADSSGDQAIGDATFIRKLLGITVESRSCHVVLTCDSNGNLT